MNWCLKDICGKYSKQKVSMLEFVIIFHISGGGFSARKYVFETAFIYEEDRMPYPIGKDGRYVFSDFEGTVKAAIDMKKYIKQLCNDSGIVWCRWMVIHILNVISIQFIKRVMMLKTTMPVDM